MLTLIVLLAVASVVVLFWLYNWLFRNPVRAFNKYVKARQAIYDEFYRLPRTERDRKEFEDILERLRNKLYGRL